MLEDEPPRSEGVQYADREEPRAITNSSRKNEKDGAKAKQQQVVAVTGDGNKA